MNTLHLHTQENKQTDAALRRRWKQAEDEQLAEDVHAALRIFQSNRHEYEYQRYRKDRILRFIKYAAIFILPIVTAFISWNYSAHYCAETSRMIQKYVPEGKIDSILLADRTKVIINSGSYIIYPTSFSKHNVTREVYVVGNCHFDVSKNAQQPFIVNMGQIKVKVLGTHFCVKSYQQDEQIRISLEEGLVKVFDDKHAITLHPNEQLSYNRNNGKMSKSKINAMDEMRWTQGELVFNSQPLKYILSDIERSYGVRFEIEHGVDTNQRYTMNFHKDEKIDDVLAVLSVVSGNIKYKKISNRIILYKSN